MSPKPTLSPATLAIHADSPLAADSAIAPPIHQTTTFRAETAEEFADMAVRPRHERYYSRYGNPTLQRVEAVVAGLEGAEAGLVTGSGMGAISASLMALCSQGDHIVAQKHHYMGTTKLLTDILPRFGITATLVDQTDPAAFEAAITPRTKLIIVESPSNPAMTITDLSAVAQLARARNILTLADNTFATPINQRPLAHGIDLAVHSATKFLGGHHDLTAGVVVGSNALVEKIWGIHIVLGSVLSPHDAFLLLRGLRTLSLRVAQHNRNALAVAQFLAAHPAVEYVHYPGLPAHPQHELAKHQMSGFGGMLSFGVRGGYAATQKFISALRLPAHATSLGGYESLVVHAAAMWIGTLGEEGLRRTGIEPNLVRFSVGLEDENDLIADLNQALEQING